jgi:hypothetical protein
MKGAVVFPHKKKEEEEEEAKAEKVDAAAWFEIKRSCTGDRDVWDIYRSGGRTKGQCSGRKEEGKLFRTKSGK